MRLTSAGLGGLVVLIEFVVKVVADEEERLWGEGVLFIHEDKEARIGMMGLTIGLDESVQLVGV